MAPSKGPSSSKPTASKKQKSALSSSSGSRVSKNKSKEKRPPPKEVKGKPRSAPDQLKKKRKREYTEQELNLPALNTITPVGVQKPRGKKKGKIFVDDQVFIRYVGSHLVWNLRFANCMRTLNQEGMATILAMVNAEKEGQIESKMMKARQLEEIREAKKKEAEARKEQKKSKLVCLLPSKFHTQS